MLQPHGGILPSSTSDTRVSGSQCLSCLPWVNRSRISTLHPIYHSQQVRPREVDISQRQPRGSSQKKKKKLRLTRCYSQFRFDLLTQYALVLPCQGGLRSQGQIKCLLQAEVNQQRLRAGESDLRLKRQWATPLDLSGLPSCSHCDPWTRAHHLSQTHILYTPTANTLTKWDPHNLCYRGVKVNI